MYSNVNYKFIQEISDKDIQIVKSDNERVSPMVSWGCSPEDDKKYKRLINRLHNRYQRQLLDLAVRKLFEKHPKKKQFTIEEILIVLKDIFPEKSLSTFVHAAKLILDYSKLINRSYFIFRINNRRKIDWGSFLSDLIHIQHLTPTTGAING